MKRSNLQRFIFKKRHLNHQKSTRKRKIIATGCMKKNARSISVILIGQKYVTILENYSTFFF